ncbi:hypothetical protein J4Q44_G00331060 [Coregonus suidteri]|uniref:Uncharacterized protein n=1 Tax=Coregonus suidteri TaxID=861788 RepID=A0AAN8KLE5_9TELE
MSWNLYPEAGPHGHTPLCLHLGPLRGPQGPSSHSHPTPEGQDWKPSSKTSSLLLPSQRPSDGVLPQSSRHCHSTGQASNSSTNHKS